MNSRRGSAGEEEGKRMLREMQRGKKKEVDKKLVTW
jgi:hypothetical protein